MIATINVTSAASNTKATRAHIPEAKGLNTGRMGELNYLFSEAGLDLVEVRESRPPQTQIHCLQRWSITWGTSPRRAALGYKPTRKSRE